MIKLDKNESIFIYNINILGTNNWLFFIHFQLHLDRNQGDQQNAASSEQKKSINRGAQNPPQQQMKQDHSNQPQGQPIGGKLEILIKN